MKKVEVKFRKSIQEFKAYNLNKLIQLRREQREFFEEIRAEKSLNDWLTIQDVMQCPVLRYDYRKNWIYFDFLKGTYGYYHSL